jgi:hypothetical protein
MFGFFTYGDKIDPYASSSDGTERCELLMEGLEMVEILDLLDMLETVVMRLSGTSIVGAV